MWTILALTTAGKNETPATNMKRALASLQKTEPGKTLQSLTLHLMIAQQFGEKDRAKGLLKDLLSRQNEDGGWSWVKENKASDAFATGQALYALGRLGRDGNDPAVRRAWEYLLKTQGKDGGWEVAQELINTRKRGLNIYPYWGTAWAAIGMLTTLPAGHELAPHPQPLTVRP